MIKEYNYKELANSAAKWGLIVGVVMSASRIYESSVMVQADVSSYVALSFEWVFSTALFVLLMLRANKQRANSLALDQGYGFREVVNYTMLISVFAAVIVAISSHIYITKVIGGYGVYAERSIEAVMKVIDEAQLGADADGSKQLIAQSVSAVDDVKSNPPTILSTIFSMVANYILGAFITSVIIFWFVRRRPSLPVDNAQGGEREIDIKEDNDGSR